MQQLCRLLFASCIVASCVRRTHGFGLAAEVNATDTLLLETKATTDVERIFDDCQFVRNPQTCDGCARYENEGCVWCKAGLKQRCIRQGAEQRCTVRTNFGSQECAGSLPLKDVGWACQYKNVCNHAARRFATWKNGYKNAAYAVPVPSQMIQKIKDSYELIADPNSHIPSFMRMKPAAFQVVHDDKGDPTNTFYIESSTGLYKGKCYEHYNAAADNPINPPLDFWCVRRNSIIPLGLRSSKLESILWDRYLGDCRCHVFNEKPGWLRKVYMKFMYPFGRSFRFIGNLIKSGPFAPLALILNGVDWIKLEAHDFRNGKGLWRWKGPSPSNPSNARDSSSNSSNYYQSVLSSSDDEDSRGSERSVQDKPGSERSVHDKPERRNSERREHNKPFSDAFDIPAPRRHSLRTASGKQQLQPMELNPPFNVDADASADAYSASA